MNLQELRIGNKLKVSNKYWTVSDILTNKNELYFKENNLTDYYLFAKPIEITEEILLKCGFEKKQSHINGVGLCVFFENKNFNYRLNEFFEVVLLKIKLKNLHQLQNLYFALTGEELEIQL